jgi:hypothetical protein
VLATSGTTRYKRKVMSLSMLERSFSSTNNTQFLTTIMYKPTSDE